MYLENYISTLSNYGLVESVRNTSISFYDNVTKHFDYRSHVNGLLLGNVQSGKTGQMLGAISVLADNHFKVFLLLTSDNVHLQQQTLERVQNSLLSFDVLGEYDDVRFLQNHLLRPMVIVLKKNHSILRKWRNLLIQSNYCLGKPVVIFDDEADAASPNNLVNKSRTSTINKRLDEIKKSASSSLYIQVTATPQSLLLQSSVSGWQPTFVNYFKPGEDYKGGDFFFSDPRSFCIRFTGDEELDEVVEDGDNICPKGLRDSMMSFLIVCADKHLSGYSNCNFLIHPSTRVAIHNRFATCVGEYFNLLVTSVDDEAFHSNLRLAWEDLQHTKPDISNFDDIKSTVIELLENMAIKIIVLNSKSCVSNNPTEPNSLKLNEGFNIIVGGNSLGRGLTFPHLQTVYYCRSSKTPQADTYWQHSRIFGYDRDVQMVRIYIPRKLHRMFVEMNKANSILINQIMSTGLQGVQLIYPNGITPTRKSVLDTNYLNIISGGTNMFASKPIEEHTDLVDELLENYDSITRSYIVESNILIEILRYTGSYDTTDFDSIKYINCIRALSAKRPHIRCRLAVRRNRDITYGTGTLLSPTDRALSDSFSEDVVLILYRINGDKEKGWNGFPVWVPNIRFPNDVNFYDIM